jgi:hypothetical protein
MTVFQGPAIVDERHRLAEEAIRGMVADAEREMTPCLTVIQGKIVHSTLGQLANENGDIIPGVQKTLPLRDVVLGDAYLARVSEPSDSEKRSDRQRSVLPGSLIGMAAGGMLGAVAGGMLGSVATLDIENNGVVANIEVSPKGRKYRSSYIKATRKSEHDIILRDRRFRNWFKLSVPEHNAYRRDVDNSPFKQ